MKNKLIQTVTALLLLAFSVPVLAQDPFAESRARFQADQKERRSDYAAFTARLDREWHAYEQQRIKAWAKFEQEVRRKWDEFAPSTRTEWVAYSLDKETRSRVDFKNGRVTIETVVEEGAPNAEELARERIRRQATVALRERDETGEPVLGEQLATVDGVEVTRENSDTYIQKEVIPEIMAASVPFIGEDGIRRQKFRVTKKMVPENLMKRAARFLPIVRRNAERFGVDPLLIMGVIQTESYFNPKAVSKSGAIGMMQVIGRQAGRDAYKYIYGRDRLLPDDYLLNPAQNIELGTAYLALLQKNHFKGIDPIKRKYLTLAGYNWGPTAVKRNILDKYHVDQMSDDELYRLLREKTPEETSNYLKKVIERAPLYASLFQQG